MTGKPMRGYHSGVLGSVEHLHVMNVGTYRVFFRAEVDAVDDSDGDPVEIKHPILATGEPKSCFR
jgi:hypothetical protein